jgi:repressor LexA
MKMGEYIRKLRTEHGFTQEELGQKLNPKVNRAAVNKWEGGKVANIKRSHIEQMAKIFDVDPVKLMCFETETPPRLMIDDSVIVPVLGKVAAGIPLFAEENIVGQIRCSEEMAAGCELFALKVEGDSMLPRIHDGDILIVRQQDDADSGDIVIALVNGDDGCVKKLVKYDSGGCALISLNPVYEPMVFDKAAVYEVPVRIIGKVIEVRSPM